MGKESEGAKLGAIRASQCMKTREMMRIILSFQS
jgi:hypothetical protein